MAFDISRSVPVHSPISQIDGMSEQAHRTKDRLSQEGPSFAETLQGYLKEVAEMERSAEQQVVSLAQGEATNVHQVMLAVEEANLALDLLIQIRNRLLDAYKELSATSI